MIPIRQASLEFEEFLMANEYDLGNSAATVAFYRKKIKPLLAWAEREGKGELNAQTLESSSAT